MKKIVLLCSAGMSTSMLVKKIREAAVKESYECTVDAYGVSEASNVVPDADCVLIGPQVRFQLDKLKKNYPDKKIESIDMMAYGRMDGQKVLAQAKKLIGD